MIAMDRNQRILVIDDDQFIHRLVSSHLKDLNVSIFPALDGASGLETARESAPDLILLDVNLPDVSGFEVCEQLRDDPVTRETPVLFLTGMEEADDKVRAFAMGAVDYVTKPFHAAELRARVHAALRTQALVAALEAQAMSDGLTKLPNREAFRRSLAKCIDHAQQAPGKSSFALLFLDLDRFKIVNDSLGHALGDELLIEVSNRLYESIRKSRRSDILHDRFGSSSGDAVARMGGDEFAILLNDVHDADAVAQVAERIKGEVGRTYNLAGHQVHCGVSIGIRMGDASCSCVETVLRDGDIAMYHAKAAGKGCYVFFDENMHQRAVERLQMEDELRQATRRRELQLVYQPIVNLDTGLLEGFESLVRWPHPRRGLIGPDEFIPIAEETGLIHELGKWVLECSCAQAAVWNQRIGSGLKVHVNVSKVQFMSDTIVNEIMTIVEDCGLDPALLVIEVTESVIMHDSRVVIPMLNELRKHGVQLAMDDFGTGYSSLAALHRFPINVLKIDREFIQRLNHSRPYAAIIEAIVTLAHNLDLDVVAEGVETQDELIALQSLNCDYAQGFYFHKPLSVEDAESLLLADQTVRSRAA